MKKLAIIFGIMSLFIACNSNTKKETSVETKSTTEAPITTKPEVRVQAQVIQLDETQYRNQIFDYVQNTRQWVYKGKRPCVVDFYAEWCRPCKMIAPYFDTLAIEYAGKVDFYRVNVDEARNLSQIFNIQSIPMVMFCNSQKAQAASGAYPIQFYRNMIDSLLVK